MDGDVMGGDAPMSLAVVTDTDFDMSFLTDGVGGTGGALDCLPVHQVVMVNVTLLYSDMSRGRYVTLF
jgi:hypothetical protein